MMHLLVGALFQSNTNRRNVAITGGVQLGVTCVIVLDCKSDVPFFGGGGPSACLRAT